MRHWNVPVVVVLAIKELVRPFLKNDVSTISYKEWINVLSRNEIEDSLQNRSLLEVVMKAIQDTKLDYHIMNLEGLLSAEEFIEESVPLRQKMERIYQEKEFDKVRFLYETDINKKKDLFLETVRAVSYMQVEELIIFKYNAEVSFYDLWNEFYMECRGVIIDLQDMKLVASPYRKFFNFNEKSCTSAEQILSLLQESIYVSIKNKEDGSMVSVTKYKDKLVVSTPGSMGSDQAKWAKMFLYKHHFKFVDEIPKYVTFIFEAIYPENRIVVDYKGEEKLVLTNIRSNLNGTYFEDGFVDFVGMLYQFPTPKRECKDLSVLLEEAQDKVLYPADQKEGWVFTIRTAKEELMFKLKCEDYCEIHKLMGVANSPKVVFAHVLQDTFDDFISKIPDVVKPLAQDVAQVIFRHIQKVKKEVEQQCSLLPKELHFTKEELDNHVAFKGCLKEDIVPNISDKLSKVIKRELEASLLAKAYGKNVQIDKYTEKEFERLWALISLELRDQKAFKQKEGRLLGFVHAHVPSLYQQMVLEYARSGKVDALSLVSLKDMDFRFLKEREDLLEE